MSAPVLDFGPEICGSLEAATGREWLVTNGLGGYASGTISGVLTRRYHGLLVAALRPPGGRTLLVSKFDETLRYDGRNFALGANRWADGSIAPDGFRLLQRFHLEGAIPVWTFACADALVEKRVWMQDGANTTFVRYQLLRSTAGAAELEIKALVNYRDFHAATRAGQWTMEITAVEKGLRIVAAENAAPFYLLSDAAEAEPRREWYRNFDLAAERRRGLDDREDHLLAGVFRARLAIGRPLTFVLTSDSPAVVDGGAALAARTGLEDKLLEYWIAAHPQASLDAPPWIRQLVLAAAQFPVRFPLADESGASTILAGYPWFGEWSRDAMIALPGLLLETGRADQARAILRTTVRSMDQGMLPNVLTETYSTSGAPMTATMGATMGAIPRYNSADATLWFFEALRQYYAATSDKALVEELYGMLVEVLNRHVQGTRYAIRMDEADGLLYAGEPGVQLTWMDAKIAGHVVTPRIGKPVEVNALWYNALRTMSRFAFELDKPVGEYVRMAERAQMSFARFWNAQAECCFDVLDGPDGNDASLRPNQILAVSLPESPLDAGQRRAIVDICARRLVTPHGLRSLDPEDPRYHGRYRGSPLERDTAYHQGTVWAWLLGPFVLAHLRAYGDPVLAFTFLEPMSRNLLAYGMGSIGEIFDGQPPFRPCGAIAQAWSVGEILRAWHACHEAGLPAKQMAAGK